MNINGHKSKGTKPVHSNIGVNSCPFVIQKELP